MNITYAEIAAQAQKWLTLAISYQSHAVSIARKSEKPEECSGALFAAYRGYARCMEMNDVCWARYDALSRSDERRAEKDEIEEAKRRRIEDKQADRDARFVSHIAMAVDVLLGILFGNVIMDFIAWVIPNRIM